MSEAKDSSVSAASLASLIGDLRRLIVDARVRAAASVNAELTGFYWRVGQRIHLDILGSRRAGYGEKLSPRWRDS